MSNTNDTNDTNDTDRGSEQEQIFGRKIRRGEARAGRVPDDVAKTARMGTIYLFENVLVPGGPGASKKFSGPLEFSPDGVPLGLWFYPANPAQHANVDRYWFDARMGVIQVKRVA